jgi:hypothetical protein
MPAPHRKSPLELAAEKWLPEPSTGRPLLDLALWGTQELGVRATGLGNLPTTEQVESQIHRLRSQPPGAEVAWVEGPEGESILSAERLAEAPDPKAAATMVFEAILASMVDPPA